MVNAPIHDVVVVGAGHSALTVVAALNDLGIRPTVFSDDERIGDTWRRRYVDLRLNTDARASAISGHPPPDGMRTWPRGHQWAEYLVHVADRLSFDHRSHRIERISAGEPGWELLLADDGVQRASNVVVATGRDQVPSIPAWPRLENTSIEVVHASSFRRGSDHDGQRVLVVGSGNSGTEIAHLLVGHAESVTISIRDRPHFVGRETLGVTITQIGRLAKRVPRRILETGSKALQRIYFGNLAEIGLGPPDVPLADLAVRQGPTVDSGFIEDVRKGLISVVEDIASFDIERVVLTDGTQVECDLVISATGYRTGLESLVPVDVLDDDGWPIVREPPFESAPGLFFAGFGPATLTAFMPDFVERLPSIAHRIAENLE